MSYQIKIEDTQIAEFENEAKYLELIECILEEIKYNYENISNENKNIEDLTEIYESISYLGRNKNLKKQTMINILDFLKLNRESFIEKFNKYYI